MKNEIQCQFDQDSKTVERCPRKATRKWGDHWFCDEHGARAKWESDEAKAEAQLDKILKP